MTTWITCPDCRVGPIGDHRKDCPRAGWNNTYRPRASTSSPAPYPGSLNSGESDRHVTVDSGAGEASK